MENMNNTVGRRDHETPGVAGAPSCLVPRTAGYHQNCGSGTDGAVTKPAFCIWITDAMFLAGRGAFPLFALVWGLNLSRHAHIRQSAINRLWGWAVIAQFAYYVAGFPWYEGNILFAFAVAAQMLTWCETRSWWRLVVRDIAAGSVAAFVRNASYGIAGATQRWRSATGCTGRKTERNVWRWLPACWP
ncbi:type-F conjugative transfer system pilin acetylase TraX [Escherichia coli]